MGCENVQSPDFREQEGWIAGVRKVRRMRSASQAVWLRRLDSMRDMWEARSVRVERLMYWWVGRVRVAVCELSKVVDPWRAGRPDSA